MSPDTDRPAQQGLTVPGLLAEAGQHLRGEFETLKRTNPHYGERGAEAEQLVRDFLNDHLPKRFAAGRGLVIDEGNAISRQSDVLVYDAANSPVYRRGPNVLILPSDNVAVAVEVKSRLDKAELLDALEKIASVKRLKKAPVGKSERTAGRGGPVMTTTMGVVFAFEGKTTLDALAGNVVEFNERAPASEWADLVVVLDDGLLAYGMKMPFDEGIAGWWGGHLEEGFVLPPYYVQLCIEKLGRLALNRMFLRIMQHLAFYRTRTGLSQRLMLGAETTAVTTVCGYQFALDRRLRPCTPDHLMGRFSAPTAKLDLLEVSTRRLVGEVGWMQWQDGAVITYIGGAPPDVVFRAFGDVLPSQGGVVPGDTRGLMWLSTVVPLTKEQFLTRASKIRGGFRAAPKPEPQD